MAVLRDTARTWVLAAALLVVCAGAAAPAAAGTTRALTVVAGDGGTVRSADGRTACGARCTVRYRAGAVVTLDAEPDRYFSFKNWTGACVGVAPQCLVAAGDARSVGAVFERLPGDASIVVGGPGAIVSRPAGFACGAGASPIGPNNGCTGIAFPQGTRTLLVPEPQPGATLKAWGGECEGAPLAGCLLTVQPHSVVTATFGSAAAAPPSGQQTLTVTGMGHVTSTPPGIDCPDACSASFANGTVVALSGASSWGGACAGLFLPCTLVMDGPQAVSDTFVAAAPPPSGLGLTVSVSGAGRVFGGAAIRCGGRRTTLRNCEQFFTPGTTVVLTAKPAKRFRVRWGGFCALARGRTCRVRITGPKTVSVLFKKR